MYPKTAGSDSVNDPDREVKQSLLNLLNSKASQEEVQQLKYDKTNKTDTDLQMKSIDIIHKQMMNMSTVLLELIKQGITNKLQTDTER